MRVRKTKYTESSRSPIQLKWLKCATCDEDVQVEESVIDVTCWRCAMKKTEPPVVRQDPTKKIGPHKPKGWQRMKVFVDIDGAVYYEGEEQPELKGTLPPTPPKHKKTRAEKDAEQIKRDAKLAKLHKKKQELKKEDGSGPKSMVENTLSEVGKVEPVPAG
jgi:hypothetical protein